MEIGLAVLLAFSCVLAALIVGRASERKEKFNEDVKKAPGRIAEGLANDAWAQPEKKKISEENDSSAKDETTSNEPKDEMAFMAVHDEKAAMAAIEQASSAFSLGGYMSAVFNVADMEAALTASKGGVKKTYMGESGGCHPPEVTFMVTMPKPCSQSFSIQPRLGVVYEFPVESPWPDLGLDLVEGPWEPLLNELCSTVPVENVYISFDALEFKVKAKGVVPIPSNLGPFISLCMAMTRHLRRALDEQE